MQEVLARYRAEDVILAGTVSELWLPNISSQVKHQLLLRVAVSMPLTSYRGEKPIDTYESFQAFLWDVYAALPSFPTLEDYIPEADWGEVSFDVRDAFIPIMYGGSVERITDFVTAFRLAQAGNVPATQDMNVALWVQSYLITHVGSQSHLRQLDIETGHLEVPPRDFWDDCRDALVSVGIATVQTLGPFSEALTIDLGSLRIPESSTAFGNSIFDGTSLPALMVRVNDTVLPLSPRSGPSVVLERWATRLVGSRDQRLHRMAYALGKFLADRFRPGEVIAGPLIPGTPEGPLPYVLSAALVSGDKLFLVVPGDILNPSSIRRMCRDVRALVSSKSQWALKLARQDTGLQVLRRDGEPFSSDDVTFIVVPTDVTAQPRMLPDIGEREHLTPPSDFVTLFDTLGGVDELAGFLSYVNKNQALVWTPFTGLTDLFGSFRDSHGLLVDGAIQPTMIGLDPHWGSNWRFKQLTKFWSSAPPDFPDGRLTWTVEPDSSNHLYRMLSKGWPALSWSTVIGACCVHMVFPFVPRIMDATNGQLLENFVHCAADALAQRREIIAGLPIFGRPRIVFVCRQEPSTVVDGTARTIAEGSLEKPLINNLKVVKQDAASRITLSIEVNLSRVQNGLHNATDASFESECATELLRSLATASGEEVAGEVMDQLAKTSTGRPRFVMQTMVRDVDVPDHADPILPEPSDYKSARRDLAVVFHDIKAEPGRHELAEAKVIIDQARDAYRTELHKRIAACDLMSLLVFCVEQHDALIAEYQRATSRIQLSLVHEVDYSRANAIAEAHDRFTRNARNYRYVIEAALSMASVGEAAEKTELTVDLLATVDWLFVLYGASDVLHNGIHPGGVELDHHYVPEVFFSDGLTEKEHEFSLEQANLKLGIELTAADEIHGLQPGQGLEAIDRAFSTDLGFTLSNLAQALATLSRWPSATGSGEIKLSYQASIDKIVEVLRDSVEGLAADEAHRIVRFATIDPLHIRVLLGKETSESDVPVWEHNKRAQRLTIRPLIPMSSGKLLWGAASVERAGRIWVGSVSDGYLPADFRWPAVKAEVRNIKKGIEKGLEKRAYEICARTAPHLAEGIDFMRRFKNEGFDDVGDFDVLAYWPDANRWIAVECKYNQPPFCLKDARRLRDRIFGDGRDHGQFDQIERRHRFLDEHLERLRQLLGWPAPASDRPPSIMDVYVGREIYWWMRNPPYKVDSHFVRIDTLDGWLKTEGS
ncbi:hypothetical protein [Rhodanobacter sp. PCA2]|uniref:hypothetical protein n=1 Tax=Rhodanobacter sp. PCA2 TaxID=2006117 RepID=UPI0015E7A7B1|nr:hypothetical protein [Rhodanobacter sp. PCA2]